MGRQPRNGCRLRRRADPVDRGANWQQNDLVGQLALLWRSTKRLHACRAACRARKRNSKPCPKSFIVRPWYPMRACEWPFERPALRFRAVRPIKLSVLRRRWPRNRTVFSIFPDSGALFSKFDARDMGASASNSFIQIIATTRNLRNCRSARFARLIKPLGPSSGPACNIGISKELGRGAELLRRRYPLGDSGSWVNGRAGVSPKARRSIWQRLLERADWALP
jgi:hypothetical protein